MARTRKASLPPQTRAEADRMRAAARAEQAARAADARLMDGATEKAAARRPDGFGLNRAALGMAANGDVDLREISQAGRTHVLARRRAHTVWARLGTIRLGQDTATLSASLVDAGERLTELYAQMTGVAGAPERDPSMPAPPIHMPGRTELPVRMLAAGERWGRLMQGFGEGSRYPAMFEGLCRDILESEFHPARRPGSVAVSRWRDVVAATTGVHNRNSQGDVVKLGCEQLSRILEAGGRRQNYS